MHHFDIRPMHSGDIDGILCVQQSVYPKVLLEDKHFFLNRLMLARNLCYVAESEKGIQGYLISYPWLMDAPPKLNILLNEIPEKAENWFIHDCAVSPACQGMGLSRQLLNAVELEARKAGLNRASLVALAEAVNYWTYQGFRSVNDPRAVLSGYGAGACWMVKELSES